MPRIMGIDTLLAWHLILFTEHMVDARIGVLYLTLGSAGKEPGCMM